MNVLNDILGENALGNLKFKMKVNLPMPSFFIEVSRDAKSSKIADECAAFVYAFIYILSSS